MELKEHKIIDFQYMQGIEEAYRTFPNSAPNEGVFTQDSGGTLPMRFRYTPPVEAWWEVSSNVGIVAHDSVDAWRYMHVGLRLEPWPQYSQLYGTPIVDSWQLCSQLGGGRQFTYRSQSKIFRLHANVPYDCKIFYSGDNTGGIWKHYCGPGYLSMHGVVYEA